MKTFALNKHKKFSFPFFLSFSFGHRQTTSKWYVVVEMVNAKRLLAHTLFLCFSFTPFTFRRIEESFPIWNSLTFLAWRTCMSMWKCEWRKVNDIPIELFYHLICSLSLKWRRNININRELWELYTKFQIQTDLNSNVRFVFFKQKVWIETKLQRTKRNCESEMKGDIAWPKRFLLRS